MSQSASPTAPSSADNPYVGLTHFTEEYADRFFGRDTECALIIGNLRAARLTLLYAESGVGKSSVLRAGVVARLHGFADRDLRTRGSPRLLPIVFSSWSERPVAALVRAIGEAARPYLGEGAELELPEDDLERAIERASAALDATLLIVLDQFEEYFLYPDDEVEAKRVAAQLAGCVNRSDLRANFLISIREDSYARLGDLFRGKVTNVYGNFLHLDFLRRAGATESIEKPIERANELEPDGDRFELEPALVAAVLDQVGRGRIAGAGEGQSADAEHNGEVETTYLQLVMRRLWEEETGAGSHHLRLRTLEGLGGAEAIIRGHLDRAMEGADEGGAGLDDDQRRVAASIFHFLVTSGGTKIALTAKDLSDLSGLPEAQIEPVLQHLSAPGLHILRPVVSEDGERQTRFEIFHDALARPIVDWRTRVEEAELDARVTRERAKKESAQRAAAAAERRAAAERKRKRLALALLGLAVVALLAGVVYFAIDQGRLADQRKAATDSVRASERITELVSAPTYGPTAAALASIEAYRLSDTVEARNQALYELQLNPGLPKVVVGHTNSVNAIAYWPDSTNFASGGSDGTVRLWNARGEELRLPLVSPGQEVFSIAVSEAAPDGARLIAAGFLSGIVKIWKLSDAGHASLYEEIPGGGAEFVWGLAFDPRRPRRLAVGGPGGRVALWDLTDPGDPERRGVRHAPGAITALEFGAGGRELFVASQGGGKIWKVSAAGLGSAVPAVGSSKVTKSVATAPNGSYAFGGAGWIDLWDAERGRKLHLRTLGEQLSLAFARGGSVLVAGSGDANVTTWDVGSARPFGPPRATPGYPVYDVAISPDGETIASASEDGLVKLWPLEPKRALANTVGGLSQGEAGSGPARISSIAVGAGGEIAAAAGAAGTSIWKPRDLEDTGPSCPSMPTEPCRLATPGRAYSEKDVRSLALAKYGDRLLLASSGYREGEGVINLWDVTDAASAGKITHLSTRRRPTTISQVAFSPASPLLAAGGEDGKLRAWNVSDPRHPDGIKIKHAHGNEAQPIAAIAFSPDGTLLASGGGDQQVVLWDVTGDGSSSLAIEATPGTLFSRNETILTLAFSPDGKVLAAGGDSGLTCLYEVESRHEIGTGACLVGHYDHHRGIESVAFGHPAGGGTSLLTAGTGQPIVAWSSVLWNLSKDDRVDRAVTSAVCAFAGRNLTSYEWSAIFDSTRLADDRRQTCPRYPLP